MTTFHEGTSLWLGCQQSLGVNVLNLDPRIQVKSVQKPVQINTMSTGNMSHGRTAAFYGHLDNSVIIFENEQRPTLAGCV